MNQQERERQNRQTLVQQAFAYAKDQVEAGEWNHAQAVDFVEEVDQRTAKSMREALEAM